jgi:hypothetical protein
MEDWMRYTTCSTGLLVLGLFLTVSGCGASAKTVAEKRASTDFNCPADKIKSEEISGGTIKVDACGKTAIYTCLGGNAGNPYDARCTREGTPAQ